MNFFYYPDHLDRAMWDKKFSFFFGWILLHQKYKKIWKKWKNFEKLEKLEKFGKNG